MWFGCSDFSDIRKIISTDTIDKIISVFYKSIFKRHKNTTLGKSIAIYRSEIGNPNITSPIDQFKKWLDEAIKIEANEPNAMAISTVSDENKPRSRYVLFKDLIGGELIFHTHYESPKAKEILNNPNI